MPTAPEGLSKPAPQDWPRASAAKRGYGRRWQWASKVFLSSYPICGARPDNQPPVMSLCHDHGYLTVATQVDHVIPHRGDMSLFWNQGNWQALCQSCHSRKTLAGS